MEMEPEIMPCARCGARGTDSRYRPPFCLPCSLAFIETEAALRNYYDLDAMGAHIDYVTRRSADFESPLSTRMGHKWSGWELEAFGIVSDQEVEGLYNDPGHDRDGKERIFSTAEVRFYPPQPSPMVGQVLWRPWEEIGRRWAINVRNDEADGPLGLTKDNKVQIDQLYEMAGLYAPSRKGRKSLEALSEDESGWRQFARRSLELRRTESHLNPEQRAFKIRAPVSGRQLTRWENKLLEEERRAR
jgi:hypothetical protein